jgi:hypothetical protein
MLANYLVQRVKCIRLKIWFTVLCKQLHLLIGIYNYLNASPLGHALSDAKSVAEVLKNKFDFLKTQHYGFLDGDGDILKPPTPESACVNAENFGGASRQRIVAAPLGLTLGFRRK